MASTLVLERVLEVIDDHAQLLLYSRKFNAGLSRMVQPFLNATRKEVFHTIT